MKRTTKETIIKILATVAISSLFVSPFFPCLLAVALLSGCLFAVALLWFS